MHKKAYSVKLIHIKLLLQLLNGIQTFLTKQSFDTDTENEQLAEMLQNSPSETTYCHLFRHKTTETSFEERNCCNVQQNRNIKAKQAHVTLFDDTKH